MHIFEKNTEEKFEKLEDFFSKDDFAKINSKHLAYLGKVNRKINR